MLAKNDRYVVKRILYDTGRPIRHLDIIYKLHETFFGRKFKFNLDGGGYYKGTDFFLISTQYILTAHSEV